MHRGHRVRRNCGVEVTELSTNKQHTLPRALRIHVTIIGSFAARHRVVFELDASRARAGRSLLGALGAITLLVAEHLVIPVLDSSDQWFG